MVICDKRYFNLIYFLRVAAMLISGGMSNWSESAGAIAGSISNMYLDFTRPQSMLVR